MLVKSQVKYIQSLSQKKVRDEEGLFVAEGPRLINELLTAPNAPLRQLFATENWCNQYPEAARQFKEHLIEVNESELERISFQNTPNEVLGLFEKPLFEEQAGGGLILMLDTLQDPGNLGTILRSADWFGIRTVICSEDSADAFNPKVVQSNLEQYLDQHPELPLYVAVLEGKPVSTIGKPEKGVLLIGNEARGISPALLARKNKIEVTIPRIGGAESLNAAVATGILLSHLT
jgi:TrmH family RNA methyltransferase